MPWWVALILVISLVCSAPPFWYARKLAREDGKPSAMPIRFGGAANLYLVPSVLKEHSNRGDRWADKALFAFWVGTAIPPVLVFSLAAYDLWSH